MSISTSSACLPERRRRPAISTARTRPSPTITPTETQSRCASRWTSARSITSRPVTQTSAICAACEPTREHDRDRQPHPVGPQEGEQAEERPPVGDGAHGLRAYPLAFGPQTRRGRRGRARSERGCQASGSGRDGRRRRAVRPRDLVAHETRRDGEPLPVRRHVQPAARARGMRQRNDGRAVALVALADRAGQLRETEQPPQREPADGDDQPRPQQLELPVAPELAELLLAAATASGRRARTARGPGSSASPRRSRRSRRTRPPRARASGAAPVRRGRATAAAPRPRRRPAPARTGTRAGPHPARAPAATRAGTPPRAQARQRAVSRWSDESERYDARRRHGHRYRF